MSQNKIITIIGPTAVGKSKLAMDIAMQNNGEIVCADSRTLYRGLDIGTAKPIQDDQVKIPHHLIDIAGPGESVSAGEFKKLARTAIKQIHARSKLPIIVGGSGLYIYGLLYDYDFPANTDMDQREYLNKLSLDQLNKKAQELDPQSYATVDNKNSRRLIRLIETVNSPKATRKQLSKNIFIAGLKTNKDLMRKRISERILIMIEAGLVDEVRRMGTLYGFDSEQMSGIGYRAFSKYIQGECSLEDATQAFINGDMRLVKKQLTWFNRNSDINWFDSPVDAKLAIDHFIMR